MESIIAVFSFIFGALIMICVFALFPVAPAGFTCTAQELVAEMPDEYKCTQYTKHSPGVRPER